MMKKNIFLLLFFTFFLQISMAQTYKVMSYNIRYGAAKDGENHWNKRKSFLKDQIAFYEPDIFGVQEALHFQVQYLDSVFSDYSYTGVGRDDGKEKGEYSAVFYNNDKFKLIEHNTFWLSDTPDSISIGWDAAMERICSYALLEIKKTKQQFWVFNTHFDHIGEQARIQSAKLIQKKIIELNTMNAPVLLTGDFNLEPTSEPIQFLSEKFDDSYVHSVQLPFGSVGTFNGFECKETFASRIDYIFTSKSNVKVLKYATFTDSKNCRYPSDHFPVFILFEFI